MTKFADHLFEDLMAEHGTALMNPAAQAEAQGRSQQAATTRRRMTRPVWTAAGGVAATVAAAVGFTVFGGGAAAAYAVTENPNGTLTVAVTNPSGVTGANDDLHKRGAQVAVIQAKDGCVPIESLASHVDARLLLTVGMQNGGNGTVTVDAKGVPKGLTVVLAFKKGEDGKMQSASVLTDKPVPTCVSIPKPGDLPPGAVVSTNNGGDSSGQTGKGDEPGTVTQTAH